MPCAVDFFVCQTPRGTNLHASPAPTFYTSPRATNSYVAPTPTWYQSPSATHFHVAPIPTWLEPPRGTHPYAAKIRTRTHTHEAGWVNIRGLGVRERGVQPQNTCLTATHRAPPPPYLYHNIEPKAVTCFASSGLLSIISSTPIYPYAISIPASYFLFIAQLSCPPPTIHSTALLYARHDGYVFLSSASMSATSPKVCSFAYSATSLCTDAGTFLIAARCPASFATYPVDACCSTPFCSTPFP